MHVGMHIDIAPNGASRPTLLLREPYREGARVRKRTLANLSALEAEMACPRTADDICVGLDKGLR